MEPSLALSVQLAKHAPLYRSFVDMLGGGNKTASGSSDKVLTLATLMPKAKGANVYKVPKNPRNPV